MTKKIDPDLFAHLMKLSSGVRIEIFEYLGQTSVSPKDITYLPARAAMLRGTLASVAKSERG